MGLASIASLEDPSPAANARTAPETVAIAYRKAFSQGYNRLKNVKNVLSYLTVVFLDHHFTSFSESPAATTFGTLLP